MIGVSIFASWSIISDERQYGEIGAVMALLSILVAVGIAVHLGAAISAITTEH